MAKLDMSQASATKGEGLDESMEWLSNRESNRRLFAVKSVARGRGVVIMIENDNEPRKGATKEAIPPGQSQKTQF